MTHDKLSDLFDVHDDMGLHPGGCHLEITGENVTEYVGGVSNVRK